MESKPKRDSFLVCLILVSATLAIYLQVIHFDFINYDDPEYVVENPRIQHGISAKTVAWAFTTTHASNWHPLTWISHMVDWSVFGANAGGHHLTNVILHLASTLVLFFALRRMTGAIWRSGFVAALFALHPLHVESVAWVSERKDVLSAFFWMLTTLFYARYATTRQASEDRWSRAASFNYFFAVVCFSLGLLAKQMLVTLPFALLLLDIWPLNRLRPISLRRFATLALEKLPFFLMTAVFIPIAMWAQKAGETVVAVEAIPIDQRIENTIVSYFRYFRKMVWPTELAVFYPYPDSWPMFLFACAAGFLIVGWGIALWQIKRRPFVFVGWSWFLGILVPVIGLVQIGSQSMADRYSYIPLIGLFMALVWTGYELTNELPFARRCFVTLLSVATLACAVTSAIQISHWKNSLSLYKHGLSVSQRNITLHMNLGSTLLEQGKTNAALEQYNAVLEINPSDALTHGNLARVYAAQGDWDRAVQHYETALQSDPRNARLHNTYGFALAKKDKLDEAVQQFKTALDLKPEFFQAAFNLGYALRRQGKSDEAIAAFKRGLEIEPSDASSQLNLGTLLLSREQVAEAEVHLREALRLRPDFAEAHHNLGMVLLAEQKTNAASSVINEAASHLKEAIRLNTNDAVAHLQLAIIASGASDTSGAVHEYREALKVKPDSSDALNNLAWILATNPDPKWRNGKEAVQLAEKACQLVEFKTPMFLGTLAAAYAESGNFEKAIETGEAAYKSATAAGQTEIAARNVELLKLYRAGQPYREPSEKK